MYCRHGKLGGPGNSAGLSACKWLHLACQSFCVFLRQLRSGSTVFNAAWPAEHVVSAVFDIYLNWENVSVNIFVGLDGNKKFRVITYASHFSSQGS